MLKFKIGDKVRVVVEHNHLTDFLADLMLDVQDRTISGARYDVLRDALETPTTEWTIASIEKSPCNDDDDEGGYVLKVGRYTTPFLFNDSELQESTHG